MRRPCAKVRGVVSGADAEETEGAMVGGSDGEKRAGGGGGERVERSGGEHEGMKRVRTRRRMRKDKRRWLVVMGKVAAVLVAGGVMGWGAWRVGVNVGVFRGVKARELVAEALASRAVAADEKKVKALVDEAMSLDGEDLVVLRAAVDVYGERGDNAVMPALRRLLGREEAGDEDLERAARVAVEWGMLELAPVRALEEWRASEDAGMAEGRMVVVARWVLMRGELEEAERRFRMAAGSGSGEAELGLCEVLLSGGGEGVYEGLERLERLIGDGERALRVRQRGAELAVRVMGVEGVREKMEETRLERFRAAFAGLAGRMDPGEAVGYQLRMHAMELAVVPGAKPGVFGRVMKKFMPLPEEEQLRIARWFLEQGASDRVLAIYEGNPHWGETEEWEALRVEALLQQGDFERASDVVGRQAGGVSGLRRALYQYRIALGSGGDAGEVAAGRTGLLKAAVDGESEEVLEAAELAAGRGDVDLAVGLYEVLEKDPEYELQAKLDVAGLQEKRVEGRARAMAALERVVKGWPRLESVRNRLIQLRLLEGRAVEGDVETAVGMAAEARGYAAYRVTGMLARLVSGKAVEALALMEAGGERGRKRVEAMSPVVSAAVLAAAGRRAEAESVRAAMGARALTDGEKALLERWMPVGR